MFGRFFNRPVSIIDHLNGTDNRCEKSKNAYIGINRLNPEQISEIFKDGFGIKVTKTQIREMLSSLDQRRYPNKMIDVTFSLKERGLKMEGISQ